MAKIAEELSQLDAASPLYATQFVELLLAAALDAGASDIHLRPTLSGLLVECRIDGVLQPLGEFSRGTAADVVARLKVLAELLTYRTDLPQEGRVKGLGPESRASKHSSALALPTSPSPPPSPPAEIRISTFPTLHGERAAVRLFTGEHQYLHLIDLGLPVEIEQALTRLIQETSGAILLTGPAGSGKTTTAYACLRDVVRTSESRRSVVTLEDPIESALNGVSQSQIQPAAGFTLATGLRSLMRQDPEVILVGEIRDMETAATVFQASLTGHLVISTFHAGSAAGALSRLLDMGIEPYLLTSGLRAILHQRLVRRLCECAGTETNGCDGCRYTRYRGRLALAELLPPLSGELNQAVLQRRETVELARVARTAGMIAIAQRAQTAIAARQTDLAEVRRVLGFSDEIQPTG